jgi:hypothetical protein
MMGSSKLIKSTWYSPQSKSQPSKKHRAKGGMQLDERLYRKAHIHTPQAINTKPSKFTGQNELAQLC